MFIRRGSAILRAPADPDPPGGSGGDNGAPKQLTEEDIGRIANQAITAQLKRLNIDQKITDALAGLDLDAKFNALAEKLKPSGNPDPKPPGGDKELPPEVAKQLQTLAEQLEAEKQARQAEKNAREEAERKHQFDAGRQRLYERLKEHADPSLHDVWVDHLLHHGRLKIEEGAPLLEVEHAPVKGMPKQKDFLPLEDAIQHLIADPSAARFMAAPEPGSDGRGGKAPKTRLPNGGALDSKNPADRVRARLAKYGINADTEFGG